MKHFLRMIKASHRGVESGGKMRPVSNQERAWFEQCQPFVFYNYSDTPTVDTDDNNDDPTSPIVNAPFPVFSCETPDGLFTPLSRGTGASVGFKVFCVMAVETAPTQFRFYAHLGLDHGEGVCVEANLAEPFAPVVKAALALIKTCSVGAEQTHKTVKLGSGKHKKSHVIRRIVHVVPKKYVEKEKDGELKHIDFSHRFNVRGHWRRLTTSALGKDRNGDYTVYNFTWVVDHEKGPEHMPLITKTRLVKGEETTPCEY